MDIKESFEKISPGEDVKEKMLTYVLDSECLNVNSEIGNSIGKEYIMKKIVMAAVLAICIITASGGVYAAYRWLSAREVATEFGDEKIAKYFDKSKDEIKVQENDKFRAAFLGIVSGRNISDYIQEDDVDKELSYIVTAVEHTDGTPMTYEDGIVVSPFVKGVKPMELNIFSMENNGAQMIVKDGVLYSLTECNSLEMFADRGVYLAVMDGPNMGQGYIYAESTGEIERNEDYKGLNFLFQLELDESKAEPDAAQEYIDRILGNDNSDTEDVSDEKSNEKDDSSLNSEESVNRENHQDFQGYNDLKNTEDVISQAKYVEGSEVKLTPDEDGKIRYFAGEIGASVSAELVKKNGVDTILLYGEDGEDTILAFVYENESYYARLYTCSKEITRKNENKK